MIETFIHPVALEGFAFALPKLELESLLVGTQLVNFGDQLEFTADLWLANGCR
ncbi:MAG: hypothetical protein BMS9Abin12_2353 [Acidimicrobiia bacterium]|nr:MAG: hypothetical protein BMS9Abin12_2353 [Acidimicrobiia bacterium]